MLCPKCNTAVSKELKICAFCGSYVDRKRAVKASAVLVSALLSFIVLFYRYAYSLTPIAEEEGVFAAIDNTDNPAASAVITAPGSAVSPEIKPGINIIVFDAANAANRFYLSTLENALYVTNKGFLYDYNAGGYITAPLINSAYMDNILILYLAASSLMDIDGLEIRPSDELVIFAAAETKEGFVISSAGNGGGTLPREDLLNVLTLYDNNHGEIKTVSPESADYSQIAALIGNLYDGRDSFMFRYLYKDNRYCAAITSPTNNPNHINGHILYYENDTWNLAMSFFEQRENYITAINTRFIDLNIELIPGIVSGALRGDFPEVARILSNGITASDDVPSFQSGTDDFCYIQMQSDRKFLGILNNSAWDITEIFSYEQAVDIMKETRDDPPIYILRVS